MEEKDKILNLIKERKPYFIAKANGKTKDEKYFDFLKENNIILPIPNITERALYDYLLNDNGKFCECGNENRFLTFNLGYTTFCSNLCLHKWRSKKMKGDNNCYHRLSSEKKKISHEKISIKLRQRIADGTFTPHVTNSWAKSRCIINIIQNGVQKIIKCRSSWDAYFQLKNPNFLYEKIRIPYVNNHKICSYIVDFVDILNKKIYEIKPFSIEKTSVNSLKFQAALSWAKNNNYEFIIINEKWFIENYDDRSLIGQPDEKKLKRLLKQFK